MSGTLFISYKGNSPTVSRPIHFYTKDSLSFNNEKEKLYGELYNKSCPDLPPRPEPRSRCRRYLLLFILNALLSLTAIILYAVVVPLWEKNFEHTRFPLRGDWTDAFMLMPLSITFLSSTYLVFYMVRRQRQRATGRHLLLPNKIARRSHGPDPFYMILLSATVLLVQTPLLVLATTNSLARAFRNGPLPTETRQGLTVCTVNNMLTRSCMPVLYQIGELQLGAAITAGLTCSIWIVVLINSARSHYHGKKEARVRKEQRRRRREARRKAREQRHEHEHERVFGPDYNTNDFYQRHYDILRPNDQKPNVGPTASFKQLSNDADFVAPLKISKRVPPVPSSTTIVAANGASMVSPARPVKYYNPALKPSHGKAHYLPQSPLARDGARMLAGPHQN